MSRGFGKIFFGKINKDQGQKIVGFVHFAEIPAPRTCARAAQKQTHDHLFICSPNKKGLSPLSLDFNLYCEIMCYTLTHKEVNRRPYLVVLIIVFE